MRVVVQRVKDARVEVDGNVLGAIDQGLLVLLGVTDGDTSDDVEKLTHKLQGLRIFSDDEGKMNLSVKDVGGSILLVSQFTLYGRAKKGFRPSFTDAADPELAEALYLEMADSLRDAGVPVETGRFGADMQVRFTNDGPVTLLIECVDGSIL